MQQFKQRVPQRCVANSVRDLTIELEAIAYSASAFPPDRDAVQCDSADGGLIAA